MTSNEKIRPSPLALPFPDLPPIDGVTIRTAQAGYAYSGRADLTFLEFTKGTVVAGVMTQNICASPEVDLCRKHLKKGTARALIVNAGNSNAFTGLKGRNTVDQMVQRMAHHLQCPENEIFISSTGVIGVPLPQDKAESGLKMVCDAPPVDWHAAATAIGTTDTFAKGARAEVSIGDKTVRIAAIIKGSGMIAPDMATMLGYIVCDAAISQDFLQKILDEYNQKTFSCITVDSDTSTSDTILAFCTGQAGNAELTGFGDDGADAFAAAFLEICQKLAQLVVRDGEGATKFITINVNGAITQNSAHKIGLAVANSPLVKTAIAGEDANWGRVVMAVGKAGEPADRDKLGIAFGGTTIAENGVAAAEYDESHVSTHLQGDEIDIAIDIGLGAGSAEIWTCDLTHGYITINADYRS